MRSRGGPPRPATRVRACLRRRRPTRWPRTCTCTSLMAWSTSGGEYRHLLSTYPVTLDGDEIIEVHPQAGVFELSSQLSNVAVKRRPGTPGRAGDVGYRLTHEAAREIAQMRWQPGNGRPYVHRQIGSFVGRACGGRP